MPRNSATGVYTAPGSSFNPATFGTPINPSDWNTLRNDMATSLAHAAASTRALYPTAGQVQDQAFTWCGTAGGTANALTLTPNPAITAYAAGQTFTFVSGAVNTGAATVNVSGIGVKTLQTGGGNTLVGGEIPNATLCTIIYDGTAFRFIDNPNAAILNIIQTIKVGTNYGNVDGTGIQVGGAGGTDPYGSFFKKDGHANWTVLQSGKIYNPVEWNIYSSAALGDCNIVAGTNTVTLLNGLPPQQDWIGEALYVGTIGGYEITAVNTTTNPAGTVGVVTVRNFGGAALTWGASQSNITWQYQVTSSDGICNVSGTAVTWVSGQKFIPFDPATIIIGGTRYTVSTATLTSITLTTSAGTQTAVAFSNRMNINDQLVCTRMQMRAGASEENMTWSARAGTEYQLSVFASGTGSCYPIRFANGGLSNGIPQYLLTIHQGSGKTGQNGDGFVALGGDDRFGAESLRVVRNPAVAINRLDIIGGDQPTYWPSLRGRGTPADVGISLDTQGAGPVDITSHSYGKYVARFFPAGASATSNLEFWNANTGTAPTVRGRSTTETNVSVGYDAQGSGSHDFTAHTFGEFVFRAFTDGQGAPNHAQIWNAATGLNPNFRGRSTNSAADIGLNFDAQNAGGFSFSNGSFSNTLLNLAGSPGGNSFVEINSGTGLAAVAVKGATNADLALTPNGTGTLRFGTYTAGALSATGYITVKDSAGNTRRLLVG